ncbi:Gfo/Idh/MocA family oxidoreductase [bacterium]|nr:MAG: Gfo/Idh/MocA family oxidoreductase [bacterium]
MAALRLGVAGLTHGHIGGLARSFREHSGFEPVAVADRTALLDGFEGFPNKYKEWREMLDQERLGALVVTSDNVESVEIAVEALRLGIPCLIEKPMASNAADAEKLLKAQRVSNAALFINWPLVWSPWLYDFKSRIDAGEIGHAFHFRYRNGHHGPKEIGCGPEFVGWLYDEKLNGGGAIADFGSYGCVAARYLLGMPESVFCVRGNYTKEYEIVDDHATIVLKYPKADAVLEGTWATFGFDSGPNAVVHGSKGTLAAFGKEVEKAVAGSDRVRTEPSSVPASGPAEAFLRCIQTGERPFGIADPELAADACRILDAAIRSSFTGCLEKP